MNPVLMIFIDGVGIGEADKEKNPFFQKEYRFFKEIFGETPHLSNQRISRENKFIFPAEAVLGVEGLPQSGTGQTSIFTGVNAQKKIGKHFGPFPHSELIPTIKRKNIFEDLKNLGLKSTFVNAYPKVFFDYINSGKKRLSVTSLSCILSGIRLNGLTDLRRGGALSAEINNYRWVKNLNYNLPVIKPQTAAKRLLKIAGENNFTLFEYFLTDHLGHWRIKDDFDYITNVLDEFLYFILKNIDDKLTLIICSDHGNFEDISVKMHTRNPSLTITAGKCAEILSQKIKKLTDIKKSILELLE